MSFYFPSSSQVFTRCEQCPSLSCSQSTAKGCPGSLACYTTLCKQKPHQIVTLISSSWYYCLKLFIIVGLGGENLCLAWKLAKLGVRKDNLAIEEKKTLSTDSYNHWESKMRMLLLMMLTVGLSYSCINVSVNLHFF